MVVGNVVRGQQFQAILRIVTALRASFQGSVMDSKELYEMHVAAAALVSTLSRASIAIAGT